MAPPATKRRKLQHSDEGSDSEGSFADVGETNGAEWEPSDAEVLSDVFMDGDEEVDGDEDEEKDEEDDDDDEEEEEDEELGDSSDDLGEGFEEDGTVTDNAKHPPPASVPTTQKPLRKPPVALQDGAYTAETFKSNVFKLQVDELLSQVKPKYGKKEAPAENAMRTLKNIIEHIPSRDPLPINEAEKALKAAGISIPFPQPRPPKNALYKLQYERPASINATGSYPLKIATRSDHALSIDLVITMPPSLFQEKDYLNHRYFYKRAYYLACLAAGIKEATEHGFRLSFNCLNGNQLQPILIVKPSGNGDAHDFSGSKCHINILLALPENNFAQNKLLPTSNCVRPKETSDENSTKTLSPTPFYNSSLQSDANLTSYLKLLHSTASKVDAFRDACVLGRIWLKQRGFGSRLREGGFGNFEWTAIMALLLQPNATTGAQPLSPGYSSYQLFKATLQFLSRGDLTKKPFIFDALNITIPKSETVPAVFDGPRNQNILFKMTRFSYERLRVEARTAVEMLSDSLFDQFESTFILKTELARYKYDATLEIPLSAFSFSSAETSYDRQVAEACQKIHSSLARALTDRIAVMSFTLPEEGSWPVNSRQPQESQRKSLLVSFATNPANANRTIDHGPAAENKQEAASFRKFWGEKAELRRFKDGSILESVVWSAKDSSASVIEQIVSYILKKHIGLTENVHFSSDIFANIVTAGRIQGTSSIAPFQSIMNAFVALEKDIRDMEDLPLHLRHLRATDPQLRYTSINPPTAGHAPASVVLQFEGSGRWPDDLCAIQRTKIAFLLRLSELLAKLETSYSARVGLENASQPAQNQGFLDVTVPTGFTFRIRIYHDREVTLFDRQLKDKALDAPSREAAAASLALYKREFVQAPLHSQVLQSLCTRFPALSPSIRLMKRWFSSHLLFPHFAPELIELLVIRTFLQPHPWPVPSSATTGFLRTLSWISRWDWRHVPLIVDFSSTFSANATDREKSSSPHSITPEALAKLQTRFEAWRHIDPAMNRLVLFAATNLDEEGTTWTDRAHPEKVVAARLTALAKAATHALRADDERLIQHINDAPSPTAPLDPASLFTTNTSDYDILITLNPKHTTAPSTARLQFKNLALQASPTTSTPLPLLFAQDLQALYGDSIIWFWDPQTLDCIAGLWNPGVTGRRGWKVRTGWNSVPVKVRKADKEGAAGTVDVEVGVNKAAVLYEIRRLGGELVKGVEGRV